MSSSSLGFIRIGVNDSFLKLNEYEKEEKLFEIFKKYLSQYNDFIDSMFSDLTIYGYL
jgi:hypothetical protein